MVVRDDGAAFLPLFLGLEMDNAVGDSEVFAEPTCNGLEGWWGLWQ